MIALLAVATLSACSSSEDKTAVKVVEEKPLVKLAQVTMRPVEQIQEYTATVEAEVKNNIAPSSPVRIKNILVEVGDRVAKGQRLVTVSVEKNKWTTVLAENYTVPSGATDIILYFETPESTIDFYIDEVAAYGEKSQSVTPTKRGPGDINGDGTIEIPIGQQGNRI